MIVLCAGIKGGTGKTTTSANLAVECAKRGRRTIIVDADVDQANITDWIGLRTQNAVSPEIEITQLNDRVLAKQVRRLSEQFDEVIIDAGGFDSAELRQALLVADRWIIPIRPTQYQLWTVQKLQQLLGGANALRGEAELQGWVLTSRASTHASRDDRGYLAEVMEGLPEFRVLQTAIRERDAHCKAEALGMGVSELPRPVHDAKATAEVISLYGELYG